MIFIVVEIWGVVDIAIQELSLPSQKFQESIKSYLTHMGRQKMCQDLTEFEFGGLMH